MELQKKSIDALLESVAILRQELQNNQDSEKEIELLGELKLLSARIYIESDLTVMSMLPEMTEDLSDSLGELGGESLEEEYLEERSEELFEAENPVEFKLADNDENLLLEEEVVTVAEEAETELDVSSVISSKEEVVEANEMEEDVEAKEIEEVVAPKEEIPLQQDLFFAAVPVLGGQKNSSSIQEELAKNANEEDLVAKIANIDFDSPEFKLPEFELPEFELPKEGVSDSEVSTIVTPVVEESVAEVVAPPVEVVPAVAEIVTPVVEDVPAVEVVPAVAEIVSPVVEVVPQAEFVSPPMEVESLQVEAVSPFAEVVAEVVVPQVEVIPSVEEVSLPVEVMLPVVDVVVPEVEVVSPFAEVEESVAEVVVPPVEVIPSVEEVSLPVEVVLPAVDVVVPPVEVVSPPISAINTVTDSPVDSSSSVQLNENGELPPPALSGMNVEAIVNQMPISRRFEFANLLFGGDIQRMGTFIHELLQAPTGSGRMDVYERWYDENNWRRRDEAASDMLRLIKRIFPS